MSPELEQLQRRVEALERIENNDAYTRHINRLIQRAENVVDADIDRSITVGVDGGTFAVLDYPDKFLRVQYNGKLYLVPAYLIDR